VEQQLNTIYDIKGKNTENLCLIQSSIFSVHIIAQRANWYIEAFHIVISSYCTIFTYRVAVVKRCRWWAH